MIANTQGLNKVNDKKQNKQLEVKVLWMKRKRKRKPRYLWVKS